MSARTMMPFGKKLLKDRRGISSVEFSLVCAVFFLFVLGIIDFSRAMWEWNAAAKATQFGVRFAVVNDIVSRDLANLKLIGVGGLAAGDAVPVGTVGTETVVCQMPTGGSVTCNGSADPANVDADAFNAIVTQMQARYDRVAPENVVIEYRHVGLGFVGNPVGPDIDPAVTVRLTGLVFEFMTPGLIGILTIDMPDFAATLTGEDLRTI